MNSTARRLPRFAAFIFCTLLLALSAPLSRSAETNHNFAKWEKEIEAYEASNRTNPAPKDCLIFTGASTMRKWTSLAQDFPHQPVVNRGVGGSEVEDITYFADRIIVPLKPRMIFFRSGGNDIHLGKTVERTYNDFKAFVAKMQATLPDTDIVWVAQNPTNARWEQRDKEKALNVLVEELSKTTPHLKYCEVYDMVNGPDGKPRNELFVADKLHFNEAGYKLLAERVRPFMPKE